VRVACETMATTNRVVIAGETRGPSAITKDYIARLAVKDIGYEQAGFHWEKASIEVHPHAQSSDIAQGVDSAGNKDDVERPQRRHR
jgi:S-adenosylmethionine synthetase